MQESLDPAAIDKQPTQQRARERFDRILLEAEQLLIEQGLSGFSIPVLAERLGYTRGSVYAYFPTPYAILNELVGRYLVQLEAMFYSRSEELRRVGLNQGIRMIVKHAADFHNAHPAARLLILGGAVTDDSYRAQERTNKRLGDLGRMVWYGGAALPAGLPDITTLAADLGTACFRRSYFEHGEITPPYREAAARAMTGFLSAYAQALAAPGSSIRSTTPKPAVQKITRRNP
ncbi:MAG: TetR/AcrR family transcriptional regulator [Nevskiaceae bacterium]|nr:MAG: TetR/AcrR family transcriptional regulator [Nevskiaceae bacterium]